MADFTVEDLEKHCDSLYRLVIAASQRAAQLANDKTPLVSVTSRKPTMVALAEIAAGKVACLAGPPDDDDLIE